MAGAPVPPQPTGSSVANSQHSLLHPPASGHGVSPVSTSIADTAHNIELDADAALGVTSNQSGRSTDRCRGRWARLAGEGCRRKGSVG